MSGAHTVVLAEGESDKSAIEALAQRRGRDLAAEGISLVAMGGATNIRTYIRRFGSFRLAGLCDVGEEVTSGGLSSAPAWDLISAEAIWRRSDSSCVSLTWRTS